MFNDEKILAAAKKLGFEIEKESNHPGFYFEDEEGSIMEAYTFEQLDDLFTSSIDYDCEINLIKSKETGSSSNMRTNGRHPVKYSTGQGKELNDLYYGYGINTDKLQETSGKTIEIGKAA